MNATNCSNWARVLVGMILSAVPFLSSAVSAADARPDSPFADNSSLSATGSGLALPIFPVLGIATNDGEGLLIRGILENADGDQIAGLETFANQHPGSAWAPSIRAWVADSYRNVGRHTKALDHWKDAWNALKDSLNPGEQHLANHVLAGQLELLSSLGRVQTLHELLMAAEGRVIDNHNDRRQIEIAREAYVIMATHPGLSYRCGSLALANIARAQQGPQSVINALVAERSTTNGISLRRLAELSRVHNLGLVARKRSDGDFVPLPAVVHWSQNHYGAVLEYRPEIDCYRIVDPTFGDPKWITTDALNAEASGYFLVPESMAPAAWLAVSDEEAGNIFGRGYPYNIDDDRDEGCKRDPTRPSEQCVPCEGMPVWWVTEPYINAWITDEPWSYTTSRGEQIGFRVTIKQRDSLTNSYNYPRPGILHNWYSKIYIRGMSTTVPATSAFSDWMATLYLGTGGERTYSKSSMNDEISKTQLQPSYGTLTDGTQYIVPGFPLGTSSVVPPTTNWYDTVSGFRVFQPDGSVDRYGLMYWRSNTSAGFYEAEALLTHRSDPLGNTTTLTYETYSNSFFRLKQVTDYDGKTNFFTYFTSNAGRLQQVTNTYGQSATFAYDSQGRMTNITDTVQLSSTVGWDSQGRVQTLITPYGTNSFNYYEVPLPDPQGDQGNAGGHDRVNRALTVVDANGGTNLYVYRFDSPNFLPSYFSGSEIPAPTPLNTLDTGSTNATNYAAVSFRNSFHWNPRQVATLSTTVVTNLVAADYLKARMRHWLGDSNDVAIVDLISVEREPSPDGSSEGQKTFYDYAGKSTNHLQGTSSQVAVIALKQPSGSTDYTWSRYNASGFITNHVSKYVLADGVEQTRTNIFVYATNTVSYTILSVCPWCVAGQQQILGCPQPPSTTTAWVYTQGAYKLNTVNTSTVSWLSLVTVVTNADQSSLKYGGYTQSSETIRYDCGNGWYHDVTKTFTAPLPTKITNEVGYITSRTYDTKSRLTGTRLPSGLTITNRYDSAGFLTNTVALEIARTNSFTYTNGLVHVHENEGGLRTTNYWDKLQRLQASYDAEGYVSNVYTRLDLTATKDKLGNWTYLVYDALRRPVAFTNANQEVSLAQYCECGTLDWVRDPLQKYTYFYYDLAGRPTNIVYPDGYSVTNKYNSIDQVVQTTDALGTTTNFYNLQGLLTMAKNAGGIVRSNIYDIMDRPTAIIAPSGITNCLSYDQRGRVLTNIVSDKLTNIFAYSTNGLIRITDGLGKSTLFSNDVAGRKLFCTNANNEVTQYKYDRAGNLTNLVDGKLQQTSFQYDQFGRLTNKLDHASTSILRLTYDANGRLKTKWTPAKGTASYIYDAVGRIRTNSYPSIPQVVFSYDARGRLTNMVDASFGATALTYSDGGQMISEDGPWSNDNLSFGYNARLRNTLKIEAPNSSPWQVSYQYDAGRRLTNVVSGAGAFGYQYHPGFGGSYDSPLWQTLTFPGGTYVSRTFDSAGRVQSTSLLNSTGGVLDSHSYAFDPVGRATNHVRFDNSSVAYTYDNAGQLKTALGKEQGGASRIHEQLSYGYDAAGNLTGRTNNDLVVTFGITNSLNQLNTVSRNSTMTVAGTSTETATSVTVKDNANAAQSATLYADKTFARAGVPLLNGNNTFTAVGQDSYGRADTNAVTVNLPTSASYQYDSNGNLTSDGIRGFDYDDADRLIRITATNSWKTEFTYDGLHRRRIRKEFIWQNSNWALTSDTRYLFDGLLPVQERDGNNLPLVTYTRGLDLSGTRQGAGGIAGLLARTDHSTITPTHAFYHSDNLGNVTALVNSNQRIVARYLYDPFGNTLSLSGPVAEANACRFSSQEFHAKSGLALYARRAYAATLQRFLNRDPIGELGGLNLYGFVHNNPLNRFDPLGLDDAMDELNRLIPGDHIPRARDLYANDPDVQDNIEETLGPFINPTPENLCKAAEKLWDFFDPPRQLREGLGMLPLLALAAGQPELAALFSLANAALYATEGNVKGTIFAGLGALPLANVVGKVAGAATKGASELTTVSRWGSEGLKAGDWVMKGPANAWNYLRSFKWQPGMGNQFTPLKAGQEFTVPGSTVQWPKGWGIDGWWKGLFGQRKYVPGTPPTPGG